jgi:hypothetical protein
MPAPPEPRSGEAVRDKRIIASGQRANARRDPRSEMPFRPSAAMAAFTRRARALLAAGVNSTVVAGENPTVGSTVWLPAESVAPGR